MNEAREAAQAECDPDEIPMIIFIGDGVSDLPAAREADVLFARRGLALDDYCRENNIPFIPFDTFSDIKAEIEKISAEDSSKTGGLGKPVRYNPRANMWRRMSSKQAVRIFPFLSLFFLWLKSYRRFIDVMLIISDPDCHVPRHTLKRRKDVPLARDILGLQAQAEPGRKWLCCCLIGDRVGRRIFYPPFDRSSDLPRGIFVLGARYSSSA